MSAIASFYLIDNDKCAGLIEAAEAQHKALTKKRWGIFPPKLPLDHDPFWDFLNKNAEELEDYPYSGYLLLDIELLVPDSLSSEDSVGKRLYEITDTTFISFRPKDASRALAAIERGDFSNDAIKKYLTEEEREEEYPESVQPIQDSVKRLEAWLRSVTETQTGILNIG